ncbi:MAG: hypothetical protein Q9162_000183 [Coniocarpon cinnabarinum]
MPDEKDPNPDPGRKSDAPSAAEDALKKLNINDIRSLMSNAAPANAKDPKTMDGHRFWQTQPVPRYDDEKEEFQEGPISGPDPSKVPKQPYPLISGFEWVTMNLEDDQEVSDVYDLLFHNYVEDDEAMFRFKYSASFLNWALKSPGWRKDWHIGIRATQSRKLVAFISAVPISLLVYPPASHSSSTAEPSKVACAEVNFLNVHKKLRDKRLAPVLIKEVTRRIHLENIWQAIYTAGTMLPTPVSTCRYYHRSLDWEKLEAVRFTRVPPGSTRQRQIARYRLPKETGTPGLREMEDKDVSQVTSLLRRYLERMRFAQDFSEEEVRHWLLDKTNKEKGMERVVFAYVVESGEGSSKNITDFFSFYRLESTVIGHKQYDTIRAAYLFYYATETAFQSSSKVNGNGKAASQETDNAALKRRLNELMRDALILAKRAQFDVFNALTLLDNPLFLTQQLFGAGDGSLHYYLYNWRMKPIEGGVGVGQPTANSPNGIGFAEESKMGGVGVVML